MVMTAPMPLNTKSAVGNVCTYLSDAPHKLLQPDQTEFVVFSIYCSRLCRGSRFERFGAHSMSQ